MVSRIPERARRSGAHARRYRTRFFVEAATEPLATRPNSTIDRVFLGLGPNGALGAEEHQWILYRACNIAGQVLEQNTGSV